MATVKTLIGNIRGKQGDPGADGQDGKSAYQSALNNGFDGTEQEWLASLKGEKGEQGVQGEKGETGSQGIQGIQGEKGEQGEKGTDGVSVSSIAQTTTSTADGGTNVVTATLSDGTKTTFNIKNGSKGSTGEKGDKGDKGDTGDLSEECVDARTSLTGRNYDDLKSRLDTEYNFMDTKASCIEGETSGDTIIDSANAPFVYMQDAGYTKQQGEPYFTGLTTTTNGVQTNAIPCKNGDTVLLTSNVTYDSIVLQFYNGSELLNEVLQPSTNTMSMTIPVADTTNVVFVLSGGSTTNKVTVTVNGNEYTPPSPNNPVRIASNGDKGYFDGELLKGYLETNGKFIANTPDSTTNSFKCNSGDVVKVIYEENAKHITVCAYNEDTFIGYGKVSALSEIEYTIPANANNFKVCIHGVLPSDAKHISVTINGNYAIPVKTTGKNMFGGIKLAQALVDSGSTNVVLDESAETVTYMHNTSTSARFLENLKENTQYTIITEGTTDSDTNNINVGVWYTDGTRDIITLGQWITQPNKTISYISYVYHSHYTTTLNYNQCGIFEGVITEEEFEEYKETVALIPITEPLYDGDYIEVYADGSGQIVRNSASVTLDGSNTWKILGSSRTDGITTFAVTSFLKGKDEKYSAISSHFTKSNIHSWALLPNGECTNVDYAIGFATSMFSTVDEWVTWVTKNPISVLCELATPTTTPLTAEQIAEFMKLRTYKTTTHINADGEKVVKYVVDTKTYIDNKFAELQALMNA